jgi:hypothetical protein
MIKSHCKKLLSAILSASMLSGCGVFVPEMQEFWGNEDDNRIRINKVIDQVRCEVGQAIRLAIQYDKENPPEKLKFFDEWGVQITLTLTVEEKTTLNPGVSLNTPIHNATTNFAGEFLPPSGSALATQTYSFLSFPQSYSFGLGGKLSTDATRVNTFHIFYPVSDFLGKGAWADNGRTDRSCLTHNPANGTLFIQSDLKVRSALFDFLLPIRSGVQNNVPNNGFSHDITFEIVSDGNITPTWKLVRVSANTSNSLFDTSRDRKQELLLTFGPIQSNGQKPTEKTADGRPQKSVSTLQTLATEAQAQHNANLIGAAVANSIGKVSP